MPDEFKCPGCGEDMGDMPSLGDHMGDCDYPNEKRLMVEIELRKLNDPDGFENCREIEESSFGFIGKGPKLPALYIPCKHPGVKFKVGGRGGDVYYIRGVDLLHAVLKAVR